MSYQNQATVDYKATKTAAAFHADDSFVRLMMGPLGCGKSVSSCMEALRRALQQEAGIDGIARVRVGIVRNTYPELKSTTIKTWLSWFPEESFGKIKWDSPITHNIFLNGLKIEVVFLALDNEDDVKKLKSFEFTFIYLNELQYIHQKIFNECFGRVGRYPSQKDGAAITWKGIFADTNPPPTRHWIYELFEVNKPDNFSIYKYEPALLKVDVVPEDKKSARSRDGTIYINNPKADYLLNYSTKDEEGNYIVAIEDIDYYLNQVPGSTDEEIKVNCLGEYGVVIDGKPIHPEYKDKLHYSEKELIYNPNVELGFGWDFGLTPAVVIVQFFNGKLSVLRELYSEYSGLEGFVENTVLPFINMKYPGWQKDYVSRHDPAGQQGMQTDERTCQQILEKFGIKSLPAATSNAPTARREGLKYHLNRLISGEPAFLLSKDCHVLREGLMGHFQYARIKTGGGGDSRYHEKPLKNMHSHPCEALEYIAMHYAKPTVQKKETSTLLTEYAREFNKINTLRARTCQR